jgi:hypothetical protein
MQATDRAEKADAKEHQIYPLVTHANAEKPIPQNRRPPRNGHGPEWAASDAGLGDNTLNSSTCSVAQTRGRVAAGDAPNCGTLTLAAIALPCKNNG